MSPFVSSNTYMAMWDKVVNKYSDHYRPYFESYKSKAGMHEVSLIGRAGEGVWSAGELLGAAAIEKGKYGKVIFCMPGERRNSPTRSFIRIADQPVHFPVSWIHQADDVLLLEEDLLNFTSIYLDFDVATVTQRMSPKGFCVVNSPKAPSELVASVSGKLVTVDATKISLEQLKSPFYMNMGVIGAYLAVRKSFSLEEMEKAIRNYTNPRGHKIFAGETGAKNIQALRAGYQGVKA